ncbi:MAG: hypothetical protein ACMVP2_25950 [Imperialibacter sp.]|uniref:hypothetical protein n=1 Tax=Imperialibacter sp. TaxID=2038411 RepID=UPI003A8785EC
MVEKVFWKCKRRGEFFEKGGKWEKEDIRIFRRSDVQIGVGRRESEDRRWKNEDRSREKEDIRMFRRLDVQKGVGRRRQETEVRSWEKEDIRMFRRSDVQKGDRRAKTEDGRLKTGVGRNKTIGYSDARMFRKETEDRIACKAGRLDKSVKILLFVLIELYITQRRKFAGANRKVVICYALSLSPLAERKQVL